MCATIRGFARLGRRVTVNGEPLLLPAFAALADGDYWYDRGSGAWGLVGGATLGFAVAELDLGGPLARDASHGTTGVFINGRELDERDLARLRELVPIAPGRWRLDRFGTLAVERGAPWRNLAAIASRRPDGVGGAWRLAGARASRPPPPIAPVRR
jgi:hypothetical protein